ncbi:HlyD family secretion protein [Aureitalea marina]|uniref:Multidrug resistance protein MdtA-like barrel-sandwich hybrid domain-containing protein n=1 Tax=Aureitalea marina TaxID=930804 RepID=A0A2S7KT25_9FLAO|nr:HlyD family secretion protein [Aureitalea marina]PQB05693.1 hypothetical protein BST85_12885 [Aureitalea marina]
MSTEQETLKNPETNNSNSKNPVRKLTHILLILIGVFMLWYVLSDRYTPYTDQGIIRGVSIPIHPRVSGYITKIHVGLHSQVKQGDTLFELDVRPFVLAVQSAEAQLDNTLQQVGAQTATVKAATGQLGVARAQLDRAQRNYYRVQQVLEENPGALSLADKDKAETSLASAVEKVTAAEANLEKAQQQLGISGEENAQYRAAQVALEKAQLDLQFTTVLAPADGAIESFNVDLGYYSQAGQALAMFVSNADFWIEAGLKENNLSRMEIGQEVEYNLDIAPGKVFKGTVRSIGFGVQSGEVNRNQLPAPSEKKGWLRDPQRFPVIIAFQPGDLSNQIRLGGQADVTVYTGGNFILDAVARFRIRASAFLSYLR